MIMVQLGWAHLATVSLTKEISLCVMLLAIWHPRVFSLVRKSLYFSKVFTVTGQEKWVQQWTINWILNERDEQKRQCQRLESLLPARTPPLICWHQWDLTPITPSGWSNSHHERPPLPAKPQIVTAQRPFAWMIVGFSVGLSEGAVLSILTAPPNTALICPKLPLQLRLL